MSGCSRWILVVALMVVLGTPTGWTQEGRDWSREQDPVDRIMTRFGLQPMFKKLGRGAGNFLGGWMEIPLAIQKRATPSDTAEGFFTAMVIGAFKGLARTGVGVYEMVTFILPFPGDYAPILPTLEYYQADTRD